MLEPDIARRCVAALVGVLVAVGASVFASWWISIPDTVPPPRPSSSLPAAPVVQAPAVEAPPSLPLAFRAAAPAPAADPATVPPPASDLARQAHDLETENARLRGRLDDMLSWILDNVRGTYPLPEHQMAHLRMAPVDDNLAVSEDLIQLLRLNEDEINRLDIAFLDSRTVLFEMESEQIQVETPDENQVLLNIPPYSQDGQLVREALYDILAHTLGQARFARFLQVAEEGLEQKFEYFGDVDRTLLFEAIHEPSSGISQLFVRDERAIPNRQDPLRIDIIASERIVDNLPEEYVPYWNWLPESVTGTSRSN